MKVCNFAVVALSLATITQSFASSKNVFDIDGYDRYTTYAEGPVSSSVIASDYAHYLDVYLHPSATTNKCYSAEVQTENTGELITFASIRTVDQHGRIHQVLTTIPDEYVAINKKLVVTCDDDSGDEYKIHVKIPSAPKIHWVLTVEPTENSQYIQPHQSFGYHTEYKANSTLRIENQTTDSFCQTTSKFSPDLGLFNGVGGADKFNSNVFMTNKVVDNGANPKPVLIQSVECQNSAGKTVARKIFDLTDEAAIELIHDEVEYH
ncbi:hypothetical protein [Pseudoalteromonas aurantia]|uniref:Uncharacterized protein n=1 Tax=Pseudoalteromonas aurantia TaxID=43654 RepID=A0A5S3V8W6_9GAMM|nr:hypothetical protein [Pseudoalteromonas aurantia]TMO56276.1 hypothetical protein CWC18_19715 [Pseudoalteromonas aurantia]TMO68336.1 hypothetical protein CWC19_09710 [Pseudoalteromonas aurantia]TMO76844.1 hypothetical protein CWC20_05280 [Pseudoalteromonas aurantia]